MEKLPNRDDLYYIELEKFEDYEFTNCITYEMCMRNSRVIEIFKIIEEIKSSSRDYSKTTYTFNLSKIIENKPEITNLKKELLEHYWLEFDDSIHHEFFINTFRDTKDIGVNIRKKNSFMICQTEKFNKNNIQSIYKRPILKIPNDLSKEIVVSLNLALPKKELIAYISSIKDDFDKDNTIVKSRLKLLNYEGCDIKEKFKEQPKKNIKIVTVDMLFAYDYFTLCEPIYRYERKKMKEELDNRKRCINKNIEYDKNDRQEQIQLATESYNDDKRSCSTESIYNEIEYEIGKSNTQVKDYIRIIKKYINELEYKKLLTGERTLICENYIN